MSPPEPQKPQETVMTSNVSIHTLITHSLFIGCATAALAVAHAAPADGDALTAVVKYADLNLDHPAGVDALYARLKGAAHQVCAPYDSRGLANLWKFRACTDDALRNALVSVDNPALTACYTAEHGGQPAPAHIANR
jgi:UrcA family protein